MKKISVVVALAALVFTAAYAVDNPASIAVRAAVPAAKAAVSAKNASAKPAADAKTQTATQAQPEVSARDAMRPVDQYTMFQMAFLPNFPASTWNSNVYGIKSGWPITCGIGRCYGLEASWFYSGTAFMRGIQASWVCCNATMMEGLQAAFVICLNQRVMSGLQATLVYTQAGDIYGVQGGMVSIAKNVTGLQAGLATAVSEDVTGFQASAVCVANGKLKGVQCNLYGQVEDSSGLQLGIVNVSKGKGFQIGAFNYMEDALLKVFPIINFAF